MTSEYKNNLQSQFEKSWLDVGGRNPLFFGEMLMVGIS